MAELYFARRPFGYGRYGRLSRGQVVELLGVANDERLIRLGYLMKHDMQREAYECAECGARFIGITERSQHGKDVHTARDLSPAEEDARIAKQERMLEKVAPLYLDKTAASQKESTAPEIRTPVAVQERPTPEPAVTPGQVVTRPKRVMGAPR